MINKNCKEFLLPGYNGISGGFDCIICIAKYTLYSQHLKSGQKIQGNPGKVSVILSRPSQASRLVPGSSRARPAIDI